MLFNGFSIGVLFGFVMSFLYTGLGLFLLITDQILIFSDFQKFGLGLILILYGFFRLYRTLKQKKENIRQGEIEDDEE
jgi:hypothetical protein